MAAKHELEIEISPTGDVQVRVKGAKGKQCMKYVELLATLGRVVDQERTSEFYEPEPDVRITEDTRARITGPDD